MSAPVVAALHVYPVKSCRGTALRRAVVGRRGLQHDRRWMVVDAAGEFLTQRSDPRLALVDVRLDDAWLTLAAAGLGEVRVSLAPGDAPRRRVRVWKSEVDAAPCGDEVARWLTEHLGRSASLVFMPDDVERAVSADHGREGDVVSFADGFPVLLATTASLDDVCVRLPSPVPMDRFRPNVVVAETAPWAEDTWREAHIGDVLLRVVKPCGRCAITTTDQRTGERGVEPLRTLAAFRTRDGGVLFGQNCIPATLGTIAVGDPVRAVVCAPP